MSDEDKHTENPDRRRFLKNTGIAAGGVVGGSLLGGFLTDQFLTKDEKEEKTASQQEKAHPTRARMFFTRFEDFVVLEHATELIFPKDDNGPGAIDLDVPYYIDKQLAGTWGTNGDDYRNGPFTKRDDLQDDDKANHARENRGKIFLDGLRAMNKESQKRFDKTFDKADDDQKGEIMSDLEAGKIKMNTISSDGFFAILKQATQEGAFCDPLYGGNKNMAGWQMKEFPGAQASYKSVIDKNEFVEMKPVSLRDYQQND